MKKTSKEKIFFISRNELVFCRNVSFYLLKLAFFSEIGNNLMRALGKKPQIFW